MGLTPAEKLRANRQRILEFYKTRNQDEAESTDVRSYGVPLKEGLMSHVSEPLGSENTWRRYGKYREVLKSDVLVVQRGVSAPRVDELVHHPEAGQDVRFPATMSYKQQPWAEHIGKHTVIVNGTHRVAAQFADPQQSMFTAVHEIPESRRRQAHAESWAERSFAYPMFRQGRAYLRVARVMTQDPTVGSVWRERGSNPPSWSNSVRKRQAERAAKQAQGTLF